MTIRDAQSVRRARALTAIWLAACLLAYAPTAEAKKRTTYTIQKGDTPVEVSKLFGVPWDEIMRYNNLKPKSPFVTGDILTIPYPGEITGELYTVKSGDSLARVADFHGVSQNDLCAANGFDKQTKLRLGQQIKIPHSLRGGVFKGHVVREGDTIASIAKQYEVTAAALARANKVEEDAPLELGRTLVVPDAGDAGLRYEPATQEGKALSGAKVKGGVRHTVQPGQSLALLAQAYAVSATAIAKANNLKVKASLSPGQKIFVPGAKNVVAVESKGSAIQPIDFVRVWNDERATLTLIGANGKLLEKSRKKLSDLAGARTGKYRIKTLHPRLILMLQRVAERFPNQKFEIISGYRPDETGEESKHSMGRAMDFRLPGVSNKELWEFIKTLPNTGAGYYPRSVFVHLDARDKSATWIDYSSPDNPTVRENVKRRQGRP